MSEQIRLSPDSMKAKAREYRGEAQNIESVIQKMDRLINELQQEWEGSSSTEFANQFARIRPSFIEGKELVETIARQLDTIADAHENLDSGMANKISSY